MVIGEKCHEQGAKEGCQSRCCKDSAVVHAGGGKDVRVDGKNVRHRHERGDTGDDLGFDRCSIFPQLECVFHQLAKLFHSFLSF